MPEESSTSSDSNPGSSRKFFLFGVLALSLVALAYDYRVARPSVELAYDKIVDRSIEVNRTNSVFTNIDVRALIGREPSRTFQDENGDTVEVFSWRSGLPIRSRCRWVRRTRGGSCIETSSP